MYIHVLTYVTEIEWCCHHDLLEPSMCFQVNSHSCLNLWHYLEMRVGTDGALFKLKNELWTAEIMVVSVAWRHSTADFQFQHICFARIWSDDLLHMQLMQWTRAVWKKEYCDDQCLPLHKRLSSLL